MCQTARELSRRGIGANEGQLLRVRPRLPRGPPPLRLQGRPAAAAGGGETRVAPTNARGCRLVGSVPGRQWFRAASATGARRESGGDWRGMGSALAGDAPTEGRGGSVQARSLTGQETPAARSTRGRFLFTLFVDKSRLGARLGVAWAHVSAATSGLAEAKTSSRPIVFTGGPEGIRTPDLRFGKSFSSIIQ
jgi:hypothetical protein